MKKFLKRTLEIFFILLLITILICAIYLYKLFYNSKDATLQKINADKVTMIKDSDGNNVWKSELTKSNSITYKELPDVFINALISAEDARFFLHDGVDLQRIISSLVTNVKEGKMQGASTLTQQLIKNTLLDSSKTLDRKLNEIILALKLENKLTKEEIIEAYCNNILFDGITLGVNNASKKFFNKSISHVNLPEAALLAGIVNAPSYYNPLRNPLNAKNRMDTVLNLMYRHGYISLSELESAKRVTIDDLIAERKSNNETYDYQAYLDIVYEEVKDILGVSFYTKPLTIETYLDVNVQKEIDRIQKGEVISFSDENQQFALALIDNETGALVASLGGRNYDGELLFNRSIDMLNQPASTIKPLLSYALGIEYLNYNSKQVLNDIEYSYADGNMVNNVDHTYLGEILIEDAIGLSRNTTALRTLDEVINKIGVARVTNYLDTINLLDIDSSSFSMAYALGAFSKGVSPLNLASAYSLIPNKGYYKKGYTVKRIIDSSTGEILYTHGDNRVKVLSTATCDILTDILSKVVENNYYSLKNLEMKDNPLYLKSGTSSFDATLLKELGYPSNASKDLWLAGFTKQYSFAIWTGFDYPKKGENDYFKVGSDIRKSYHKQILKRVLEVATTNKGKIELTSEVTPVYIVKGTNYLPNEYVSPNLLTLAYYKRGTEPTEFLPLPSLKEITNLDLFYEDNYLDITFSDYAIIDITKKEKTLFSFNKVYGDLEYVVEVNDFIYTSSSPNFQIALDTSLYYKLKAYVRYSKAQNIISNIYEEEFSFF